MDLSKRQRQTINVALTILASAVIIAAALGLFWILTKFVQTFSHVFLPLVVAGIGSLVFQPYYNWLRKRLPTSLAVIALFSSVLVPLGIFFGFFGVIVFQQIVDLIKNPPEVFRDLPSKIEEFIPNVKEFFGENPLGQKISQLLQGLGPMIVSSLEFVATSSLAAGNSLAGMTGALLSWAVAPVYFVFFLIMDHKDVRGLEHHLPFLKPETRKDAVFLVNEFVNIIVAFFRGQIVIAFLQGVLLAFGFSIVGLKYGLLLGFLVGFLNVIPYLGSMVGLAVTLPLAYFHDFARNGGDVTTLVGVVVVLLAVQTIEGYLLTPKIMGDRTGLHPMAIIFAVFFWGAALGGILGMILAIPLTAFFVVLWRLVKDKYISELV